MSVWTIIMLLIFAAGASFIQRVTGFGFGIFIMTALPHLMPSYGEATALSGMLAIITVLITGIKFIRYISWRKLSLILLVFLLVSYFSVKFVAIVDGNGLKRVLGVILVVISIYFLLFSQKIHLPGNRGVQVGMGTLSGIMGGLFAMQGPPAVIYFLSCSESKEEYIGLCSWYFLIGNTVMTFFRMGNGFVTPIVTKCALIGIPAVIAGYVIGNIVYKKMPIEKIRICVYAYMAISGVIAILT